MRKLVQFGCSLCIMFASLLHACLALYVDQVNERKHETGVCVVHGKASLNKLVPGTNKHFFGLVFTASRLLPPTKSVTQAVSASTCCFSCLEDVCLLILHLRRCIPLE
jgi:hypothetical protein